MLILTYGYRAASDIGAAGPVSDPAASYDAAGPAAAESRPDIGSGQRVLLSYDNGASWSEPLILREDGPDGDLGYPATVELGDGTLLTVYYQKLAAGRKASILYTVWRL